MKLPAALALLPLVGGCATHRAPVSPPIVTGLVFNETLPAETRVCVPRTPFSTDIECLTLGDLRAWLRHRSLARFGEAP